MKAAYFKVAGALILSAAGIAGIVQFEGKANRVYMDPVNIPTVCVGHTATVSRADVGKVYSDAQCQALLQQDTKDAQAAVKRVLTAPVTQDQYDALVSLAFNIGSGALAKSTLVRKHNAGDCLGAAREFTRWNKAGGRVLPGLTKRRAWEKSLYEKGC